MKKLIEVDITKDIIIGVLEEFIEDHSEKSLSYLWHVDDAKMCLKQAKAIRTLLRWYGYETDDISSYREDLEEKITENIKFLKKKVQELETKE